jgi:hypothetical protein
MTRKHLLIAAAITAALLLSVGAYAGGGMGGGMGGGVGIKGETSHVMMGGQGHGIMGSRTNDMMGSSRIFSSPWTSQPRRSPTYQYKQQERVRLRGEVREKRQELSDLYRSDKPNQGLIDQKIAELNELESAYDRSFSGAN